KWMQNTLDAIEGKATYANISDIIYNEMAYQEKCRFGLYLYLSKDERIKEHLEAMEKDAHYCW
ncbi:unnamed protein product, partial [Schistosoma turkestanicum]